MMGFVLQDGRTPLVAAIHNEHLVIVKSLIEAGANFNHTSVIKTPSFRVLKFHTWVSVQFNK